MFFSHPKPLGETPLETLERFRVDKNISEDVPMTYAGRLDPMAEGLLLILVGDECKKKDEYLGLDKEYDLEVLLGVESDTGDVLGKLKSRIMKDKSRDNNLKITTELAKEKIKLLVGKRTENYPAYSSKPVGGKPLFMHAREGTIDDIEIPTKDIEIYSIDYLGIKNISRAELLKTVKERIEKVKGDFRQEEIISSWNNIDESQNDFQIISLHVKSSSGAYMRTLAEKLGQILDIPALAWKIKRTKIGDFTL